MRALVTGGAGFIGSNLVDGLLARGDGEVPPVVAGSGTGGAARQRPPQRGQALGGGVGEVRDEAYAADGAVAYGAGAGAFEVGLQ